MMAESEKGLEVTEQKEVLFYDDALTAVRGSDGRVYVSIRQMCQALGLNAQAQTRRIQRQPILNDGYWGVAMMATPGGMQKTQVLRVDLVPLWLSGIDTGRVNDEIRPKLIRFQKEAATVLWEAFQEGRLTMNTPFDELLSQMDNEAVQAYKIAQAVMKLAQNQILMEARLIGRIDDHEQRLEALEAQAQSPKHAVTEDQASQISQAVKTVAIALGKQTKRNEFGAVYGEMYRKFGVTSYKLLPAGKFEEAMAWLSDWYGQLTDDAPF